MEGTEKTKDELLRELQELHCRVGELERRLEESGSRYEELPRLLPQVVFEIDNTGILTFVNDYAFQFFGYEREVFGKGFNVLTVISPEDRPRALENVKRVLAGESLAGNEYSACTKGGEKLQVAIYAVPVVTQGKVVGARGILVDISEKKRAERLIRESEEKFFRIFSASPDGIVISHLRDGLIVDANEGFFLETGYKREDVIGKTGLDLDLWVHIKDREKVAEILGESGALRNFETLLRTCDGRIIPVLLSARTTEFSGEMQVVFIIHNISELKESEKALRASEERYRTAIENSYDGITIVRDGCSLFANERLAEMFGYAPQEMISMPLSVAVHPDDVSKALDMNRRQFHNDRVTSRYEAKCVRKDGETIYVEAAVTNIEYEGKPAALGYIRDITDKKRAEYAMKESEERFRAVFDTAVDSIFIKDRELRYLLVNPAMERAFKLPAGEWTGKTDQELFGEEMTPNIELADSRVLDGEVVKGEDARQLQGITRTFSIVKVPMKDDTGEVTGVCGIARDITTRRELESRLLQAHKMEAIGTLAGGIAHDFNNILMGIQGYASLVLYELDESHPYFEKMRCIEELVRSGASLTMQLLGFARGGRYEVKPVDLNELVDKSSRMFGRTKKEIVIHYKLEKDLYAVEVDGRQVEQVLLNLYVNAWQAMPRGGNLYLETGNVELTDQDVKAYSFQPGRYVRVSVTDTGTGMDKKTLERIFEPFFTTKEMGRGTGLGLASAYGIIKGHNGIIRAESEPGRGTSFTIYLPASEKGVEREEIVLPGLEKGTETVLLVDDEKAILEVTRQILEVLGYRVLTATDGREAVEVFRKQGATIDLVILDMVMPDMGGEDTFTLLKEIRPDVIVILSSGYSMDGQASRIINLGCKAFVQKPFGVQELSATIRRVLEDR